MHTIGINYYNSYLKFPASKIPSVKKTGKYQTFPDNRKLGNNFVYWHHRILIYLEIVIKRLTIMVV